jgi:hypothetical protein
MKSAIINTITYIAISTIAVATTLYSVGYRLNLKLLRPGEKDSPSPPTTPRPQRTYNPPKFDECIKLQESLHKIKAHILASASTCSIYMIICDFFNRQMEEDQTVTEPSDSTIQDTFLSSWPTFLPLREQHMLDPSKVNWAFIDKSTSSHEIQINPDLVSALESTSKVSVA